MATASRRPSPRKTAGRKKKAAPQTAFTAFRVRQDKTGGPDIGFIRAMDADQLLTWFRARLSGNDPHYPLYKRRGQDPVGLFINLFGEISNERFIANSERAIRQLIEETFAKTIKPEKSDDTDNEFIYSLLRLAGHFYGTYQERAHSNETAKISERLRRLCSPENEALRGKTVDGIDLLFTALFALRTSEGVPDPGFWETTFYRDGGKKGIRGGRYSTPAFGALVRWELNKAIELLPEYMRAAIDFPGKVTPDFEVFWLYDDRPARKNEIDRKIDASFAGREEERDKFLKVCEEQDIDFSWPTLKQSPPSENIKPNLKSFNHRAHKIIHQKSNGKTPTPHWLSNALPITSLRESRL